MTFQDPYAPGVTRNAAAAQIARPDLDQKRPVATFSNPAEKTQSFVGTGSITNSAAQRNRKGPKAARSMPSQGDQVSPLQLDGISDVIDQSGLGKPRSWAENESDADPGTQAVRFDQNGNATHYRASPSGSVTPSPIGAEASYLNGLA